MSVNIAKIVESCGQNRVKKISVDGEKVEIEFFGDYVSPLVEQTQTFTELPPAAVEPLTISQDFKKVEKAIEIDEDFETLPISDPLKYEELQTMGKVDEYGEKEYAEA
jgi:hypothetical protein